MTKRNFTVTRVYQGALHQLEMADSLDKSEVDDAWRAAAVAASTYSDIGRYVDRIFVYYDADDDMQALAEEDFDLAHGDPHPLAKFVVIGVDLMDISAHTALG